MLGFLFIMIVFLVIGHNYKRLVGIDKNLFMKKIILVVTGIFALTIAIVALGQGFAPSDLTSKNNLKYYDAGMFAMDHSYMDTVKGKFQPQKTVTRGELANIMQKFAYNVRFEKGEKNYKDPWYGFELTFPSSWEGYLFERKETPKALLNQDEPRFKTNVNFGFLENNDKFWGLMEVQVWSKASWKKAKALNAGYQILGQDSADVVTYLFTGEMDTPPELVDQESTKLEIPPSFRM